MARLLAILLAFVAVSGCIAPPKTSDTHRQRQPAIRTLIREALEAARLGDRSQAHELGIDLSGYNWSQEITLGAEWSCESENSGPVFYAFLISRNTIGEMLVLAGDDRLISRNEIPEALSFQLLDVDWDGVSELLVEQYDTRGTGIFESRYHLYKVDHAAQVCTIWEEASSWRYAIGKLNESGTSLLRVEQFTGAGDQLCYFSRGTYDGSPIKRLESWAFNGHQMAKLPSAKCGA